MPSEGDQPYKLGDGDREQTSRALALLDAIKAARPVEITAAEREADKEKIKQLEAKVETLQRLALVHSDKLRALKGQVQALNSAVAALQQQSRSTRSAAPTRRRDALDDALETEIHS